MELTARLQLTRSPEERYRLAVAERNRFPVKQPSEEEVREYKQRLDVLGRLLHEAAFKWYVEGGYVLPLRTGHFSRQHADIDIGVFVLDINLLEQLLADKSYGLFYRNPYFKHFEYTPFDLWQRISSQDVHSGRVKRLYAVKITSEGSIDKEDQVLREIDIHCHTALDGNVQTGRQKGKKRYVLPYEWFTASQHYRTKSDDILQVGTLQLFYFFKLGGRRPRHVFDRKMIEEQNLLSREEIDTIKRIRQNYDLCH